MRVVDGLRILESDDYSLILVTAARIADDRSGRKHRTDVIGVILQSLSWRKTKYTREEIGSVLDRSIGRVIEDSGVKFGQYKPRNKH